MKRDWTSVVCVAALVALVGAILLWPLLPTKISAVTVVLGVAKAAGALFATFFGAAAAFHLNARRDDRKILQEKVQRCNSALLVLSRQFNYLLAYSQSFLAEHENSPIRHLALPPMPQIALSAWTVDAAGLSFLVGTACHDVPFDLALQDDRFHAAIQTINDRSSFHLGEAQPRLETLGDEEEMRTLREIEKMLGPRITGHLRKATDEIYRHVQTTIESHEDAMRRIAPRLKQLMPGEQFVYARRPSTDLNA